MKKVLIIGGEGHGSVIASCINDNRNFYKDYELEVAGFINDFEDYIDNYPVLGKISDIDTLTKEGFYFAWGIHLIGKNTMTNEVFSRANIPIDRLVTVIHHSAFIGEDVVLEPGVLVMCNVYIASRTHIGKCSMIKANACIGHDINTGPLCHFAMGSITGSYSQLGTCVNIAIGATVLEHILMGDNSMAAARSLITHNVPENAIFAGIPAKLFKYINK